MRDTNEWISENSVVWRDPTICSEEEQIHKHENELRQFAVTTCLQIPEYISDPFLEFIEFIEQESWKCDDVIRFRTLMHRIIHILEPIAIHEGSYQIDMTKWYSIDAFSETWRAKVQDVPEMWETELNHILN